MIRIPNAETKKYSQPNTSDLFGSLWYTKSLNFDEQGYAKLSSRAILFKSEQDDSDFNLPISFGRQEQEFHIITTDQPYDMNVSETNFSIAVDTSANSPNLSFDSWGRWFQNRWHATDLTKLWYETGTGSGWTDTGIALTSGKMHPLEVFRNKSSLAVGNGNTVKLLDTTYSTTVTLTIPTDYEINGLCYSNNNMAVAAMLSDVTGGQNQEAYLFIWDGSTASANRGFGVGSDMIMGLTAYKSSWVILTRAGELKYFNGGGFDLLATMPFAYRNTTWGDATNRDMIGDTLTVEGDLIYINFGNSFQNYGKNGESYVQNNPAGILCYDPNVGLYHRYAPSISYGYQVKVLTADVNTTTDVMTKNSGTLPDTGNPIKYVYNSTSLIGGLTMERVYYIIKLSSTTFALALTKADALAGTKIDLTAANDGNFLAVDVVDYGASKTERTGGIGIVVTRKEVADHLLFGAELFDVNSDTDYDTLCVTVPKFENRGYLVTAKVMADSVEDLLQKLYIKHRPLGANDQIIVKYKDKDIYAIPTSVPQFNATNQCNWTDTDTFTTTADLSMIKTFLDADVLNQCEVEIIAGAGAGQMAQISSIDYAGGTYTIVLAEELDGAVSGNKCYISIDNWKLLKTTGGSSAITSSNTKGWEEFPVATSSKWIMFKIELRGDETTIEEFLGIFTPQLK